MSNFINKISRSKELIKQGVEKYKNIASACSFGKDSMVVAHLVKEVAPEIPFFYAATIFKPQETLDYAAAMTKKYGLDLTVYLAAKDVPIVFKKAGIKVVLLPTKEYELAENASREQSGKPLYRSNPDLCCELLKVAPTKVAVKNLDAWFTGLRKTEGFTRQSFQEIEMKGGLIKINPILEWTELDVWRYLALNNVPVNPLYAKGYRSLGCAVCTKIVDDDQNERDGRWQDTSKCGGECGIHTKVLK